MPGRRSGPLHINELHRVLVPANRVELASYVLGQAGSDVECESLAGRRQQGGPKRLGEFAGLVTLRALSTGHRPSNRVRRAALARIYACLLYTSPSPRDR